MDAELGPRRSPSFSILPASFRAVFLGPLLTFSVFPVYGPALVSAFLRCLPAPCPLPPPPLALSPIMAARIARFTARRRKRSRWALSIIYRELLRDDERSSARDSLPFLVLFLVLFPCCSPIASIALSAVVSRNREDRPPPATCRAALGKQVGRGPRQRAQVVR